ncbi:hypothetical protein [Streptomyces griseoviridis]|uniref:DNA-binding CsgD family transcriptional regulator n=1 Tax=Streptomyces griseoviridis TaxID=45398 RepID=A0ABT9LFG0_STRGD|nr:hypothetical protein [Streptomyces griseoviridis]MDP9682399.1 DNA-binding CsgD family transcriptional regulator [Streptomyces griseoviridis]GGS81751.1 hypothetical protein GCM10010240_13880 [Streptomyces griseoviridis]
MTATRADIVAMLRDGHSNSRIARELRCDKGRVRRIRTELDLPAYVPTEQTRTLEEKWATHTRPVDGGHLEWTGERATASGTPTFRYKEQSHSPAAVAFRIRTGREAVGYVIADCGMQHCVAPDHVDDEAGRQVKRMEKRRERGLDSRPAVCPHGHDQGAHGRLEPDGTAYCEACKRDRQAVPPDEKEARRRGRAATRQRIEVLLRQGVAHTEIARRLGVNRKTVRKLHDALGLPARRRVRRPSHTSPEDAFRAHTRLSTGGHVLWTGYADGALPIVCHGTVKTPAPRIAFRLHHGRDPEGRLTRTCDMPGCVAGAHYADRLIRDAHKRADKAFAVIFGLSA